MKLGFGAIAFSLAIALASTQSTTIEQLLSEIPACAQQCAISAAASSPCIANQTLACLCANFQPIESSVNSCVKQQGVCSSADLNVISALESSICSTPPSMSSSTSSTVTTATTPSVSVGTSSSVSMSVRSSISVSASSSVSVSTSSTSASRTTTVTSTSTSSIALATFTGGATNAGTSHGIIAVLVAIAWAL